MTEVSASQGPAASSQDLALMARDQAHMARALNLAPRGLYTTDPNPRVGCVVVRDDRVLGEGWHVRAGEPHAEVLALRAASPDARGATVYVTLEPCSHTGRTPPCADALIAAGVARVVCSDDPRLDVRLAYGSWVRQPLRVLLDPMLTCSVGAKLFLGTGALVFAATDAPVRAQDSARVERLARAAGGLDLHAVIRRLTELEINELLIDCGPRLS